MGERERERDRENEKIAKKKERNDLNRIRDR